MQAGKHAAIDSDYVPMTADEKQILTDGVDESYHEFVNKVAEARHAKYDDIEPFAQGRVWLGSQAKDHNLIDSLGGLDAAVALVKKKANIPDGENVTIFSYPPQTSIFNLLTKKSEENMFDGKIRQVVGNMPFHAWMRGGYLRMMPVWFEVR